MAQSSTEVEQVLHSLPPNDARDDQLETLEQMLAKVLADQEDPASATSPPAASPPVDVLCLCLQRRDVQARPQLLQVLLRAVKVLARRQGVRQSCSARGIHTLLGFMGQPSAALATEATNALLNLCYEGQNVAHLLAAKGEAALLGLLARPPGTESSAEAVALQTVAAAALQTVSFQADGRTALVRAGAVAALLSCLSTAEEGRLQQRLVGSLQNLTAQGAAVQQIRQQGGIPTLTRVLALSGSEGCLADAAGALQNISREDESRAAIGEMPGVLPRLITLLASSNTQVRRPEAPAAEACSSGRADGAGLRLGSAFSA